MKNIDNAKITSAPLGVDRGILTSFIMWESDGISGGFGGLRLEGPALAIWTKSILELFECHDWSCLKDTFIRVESNNIQTLAIGHLIKDKWLSIDGLVKAIQEANKGK